MMSLDTHMLKSKYNDDPLYIRLSDEIKSLTLDEYKSRLERLYKLEKTYFNESDLGSFSIFVEYNELPTMTKLLLSDLVFAELNLRIDVLDKFENTAKKLKQLHSKIKMTGHSDFYIETLQVAQALVFVIGYKPDSKNKNNTTNGTGDSQYTYAEMNYNLSKDIISKLDKETTLYDRVLLYNQTEITELMYPRSNEIVYWSPYEYAKSINSEALYSPFKMREYTVEKTVGSKIYKTLNTLNPDKQALSDWYIATLKDLITEYNKALEILCLELPMMGWTNHKNQVYAIIEFKIMLELLQNDNFKDMLYIKSDEIYSDDDKYKDQGLQKYIENQVAKQIYSAVTSIEGSIKSLSNNDEYWSNSQAYPKYASGQSRMKLFNQLTQTKFVEHFSYQGNQYDIKFNKRISEFLYKDGLRTILLGDTEHSKFGKAIIQ
jgi:hypothetical protein